MVWKFIWQTFLKGLAVVIPAFVTLYILWFVTSALESSLKGLIQNIPWLPYIPGLGITLVASLIFVIGLAMNARLLRQIFQAIERQIERIPLIDSLYGSFRDLMQFISGDTDKQLGRVVVVDLADGQHRLLGFMTRSDFRDVPAGIGDKDRVAVYLPMSYQLGGFTTLVQRDRVKPIDMSIDQAMRFALFGGVKRENDGESGSSARREAE